MNVKLQRERRAIRSAAKWCQLELSLDDLAMIANRIQHADEHPDDVQYLERFSIRVTVWRVRVGKSWYRVQYDTHRHLIDAFLTKESERSDVDTKGRVESDSRSS